MKKSTKHNKNSIKRMKGRKPWNKGKRFVKHIKKICQNCGKEFEIPPCYKERIECCSKKCRYENTIKKGVFKKEKNPMWKGGEIRNQDGYVLIKMPEHPKAYQNGYIKRATLVIEKKIGRYLEKGEVVHHINGIKDDDSPKNLIILLNSQHSSHHRISDLKRGKNRLKGDKG